MKHPTRQPGREEQTESGTTAIEIAERRSAPRQHFVAEAQIVEISSGVRLSARSCDLVAHGCYVDTLIPFPVGTPVRIRLTKDKIMAEANGNVVYRLAGLGMGISFQEITPESQAVLDKWLSHADVPQGSLEALLPPIEPTRLAISGRESATAFVELIELLMKKGIVTATEALTLLQKSLDEKRIAPG